MAKAQPIFIYAKDLMRIFTHLTSYSGAMYRYNIMKTTLNKKKHQFVTVVEFSDYEGLPIEKVYENLL